ncbi:hypothetical protein K440DRAFT_635869 [Wilcoxina mikolae CBS 423.85]|nr:hypothetical protein K440DRAFT_635869 [Wilcoxina mikolae CBS 423.85]
MFSPTLLLLHLLLFTLTASAWRIRMFDGSAQSTRIVNRTQNNIDTDQCYNIPGNSNNQATYYEYISSKSGIKRDYPGCRIRVYDDSGCAGQPFIDTWHDVEFRRINSPVCMPQGGTESDG